MQNQGVIVENGESFVHGKSERGKVDEGVSKRVESSVTKKSSGMKLLHSGR